ncbi:hypothetical protein [Leptospira noguchii]|uniref:hypothetical protein n=1 Tax=Leptospira noguchii TaxID=28182 RepID=UPI000774C6C6|nr:hypothetical protein [Leptospira noguchii]
MIQCFLDILDFLSKNKNGIEILISIFKNLGTFILFLFGGFLSYLAIFREIRFARIKELHNQQNEFIKYVQEEAYNSMVLFETKMIGKNAKTLININVILKCKSILSNLFKFSTKVNSSIANQLHLLQTFLNHCIEILKIYKNIKSWELVDEFHLYNYLILYLNNILIITSKEEKVLNIWDLIRPNIKNKTYNFLLFFLTHSKRPYKSKNFENGVNFSYLSPYILSNVIFTLYYPNYLFPFTLFSTINLQNYIARALYREFTYFPLEFEIEKNTYTNQKMKFKLFKIEKKIRLSSRKKIVKFHYFKEITYERIDSKIFFDSMKKKKDFYFLKDKYHPFTYKIHESNIEFSNLYGGTNIVTIEVVGHLTLNFYFIKNIIFILINLLKKKDN